MPAAAPLPDNSRFQHPSHLSWSELGGEILILDMDRKVSHRLLPTAAFIWKRCDGCHRVADMFADLLAAFDVNAAQARADLDEILRRFLDAGIIVEAE